MNKSAARTGGCAVGSAQSVQFSPSGGLSSFDQTHPSCFLFPANALPKGDWHYRAEPVDQRMENDDEPDYRRRASEAAG